jgi:hypothetical protein
VPSLIRRASALAACCAAALHLLGASAGQQPLGAPRHLAPGIALYHLTDPALIDPPGPVSIWALRLQAGSADLRPALANDEILDTETVADIAARHRAVAAINGGFFLPSGDPAGLYKLKGQLVSDSRRPRGAVGIYRYGDAFRLLFDRVTASATLVIARGRGRAVRVPIAGVDTTRLSGRVMLFTPAYHDDTDTTAGGLEWVIDGDPLRVVGGPHTEGRTVIPRSGFVVSYGGITAPPELARLARGTRVHIEVQYDTSAGSATEWSATSEIIGGAGLLARGGRYVTDWRMERFQKGFAELRHPRTMIGTARDRAIWLVTVDGRQPQLSAGMTLVELRALARRLQLTDALNLDGGGSTTMWVGGKVVNSPSDVAGPRKVSDAILVFGAAK